MADVADVLNALVALAAQTMYPLGTGSPSLPGFPIRIYAGWPAPQQLDADLKIGTCHVSVFPRPEERNTSRYPKDWVVQAVNTPTLTLVIAGQTITVGGTVPASGNPHNMSVLANGNPYVYSVQQGIDTLTSIATALAALIGAAITGTTSAGPVITLPIAARITAARVGVGGTSIRELRRQERQFQLLIWADTPAHRDAIAQPLDVALAALSFITLIDQSAARVIYKGSAILDNYQKDKLYRRDLFYTIEYATTQIDVETQITQEQLNTSVTLDGVTSASPVTTTYS